MTQASVTASDVALQVVQQAVSVLAKWADAKLPDECQVREDSDAIAQAKQTLSWTKDAQINSLRLLFDNVHLSQCQLDEFQRPLEHYWPAIAIANDNPTIPYPQAKKPTLAELECLKLEIQDEISQLKLNPNDWQNLSLLTLILEKFGSYLSFGECNVALIDIVRSTAAVAAALANNHKAAELCLIAGDLSGIQKFIYTIASDGALKSLRARSFYLELVTEEIVQQLLSELELPRTNVIYAGGGNLYILASDETKEVENIVNTIRERFNEWLRRSFQGKVFLALDYLTFPTSDVKTKEFAEYWEKATNKLANQKLRKFESQISDFLKPSRSYEPCRVCHRDDLPSLKPLNRHEPDSSPACWTCRNMFDLGSCLFGVNAVVRSKRSNIKGAVARLYLPGFYYYLFSLTEPILAIEKAEIKFLINNWNLENYRADKTVSLLLGNYGQLTQIKGESGFMPAGEMAEQAKNLGCIARVGYLRMDVDRLGQIFAKGLGNEQTLTRLAGLSRQMSYFFKVYLNSLAEDRLTNLPQTHQNVKCLTQQPRQNILFIYAGGDDLFVSGAWNEVVEFAFDVYQSFRAYTGKNPDITLSGGISIAEAKFPLYQAADESGEAEDGAKGNGRDSLGLFGEVFKWDEWLGIEDIAVIDKEIRNYLSPEAVPNLLGVFPFVKELQNQVEINYSRSFVRNLLLTADLQKQMIKKIKDKPLEQQRDIRYYLHLPKVAYTLARLPDNVRNARSFEPVRTSLKSPYNAPYFRVIATWLELLNRS